MNNWILNTRFSGLFLQHTEEMSVLNIYMQRDARRALRRQGLYRDVFNPLEMYDEVEIKKLYRFERVHIISTTEDVNEYLQRVTAKVVL